MRAVVYESFAGPLSPADVAIPTVPDHAALVRVGATGVCRSDHHAWQGLDDTVTLPHVPGHEFAGIVERVGARVTLWHGGERVTAPFVNACGRCISCREGHGTVCLEQTQPGFDRWGSWAEFVVVDHADVNLVALPDDLDDPTAAALGCRFATAYRAVAILAEVRPGQQVLVAGCGGVGLSAVMVAAARGCRVIAVDPSSAARARARELGADEALTSSIDLVSQVRDLTDGGVHASIDALGHPELLDACLRSLRPRGVHVQVGLLMGAAACPPVPMARLIGRELRLLGSHGMAAPDYPAMLDEVASGLLQPSLLVGTITGLHGAHAALSAMSGPAGLAGTTVLVP